MESAEKLLSQNYQPERTVYFVFGHDEEISGKKGAVQIAALLQYRNVKADLIMDEGGFVTREKVPGLNKPVALIATAEKGYMTLDLSVTKKGGHSSMPDNETAIDIFVKRYEAYFILAKLMALNSDTETAREILIKGAEVCKTTIELNYAICAIAFMENKPKEGEVLLRMLLEENFGAHQTLFDFSEELRENVTIGNILAEYN